MTNFRHLLCAAVLILLIATQASAADIQTGDAELDAVFNLFIHGKADDKFAALSTLANSTRDDKDMLLEGILNGKLMLLKRDARIVWVSKLGRKLAISDLLTHEPLGVEKKRKLKRLSINNQLRTKLRALIASLDLRSEDPVSRLKATRSLLNQPDAIDAATLTELLANEQEPKIRSSLQTIQSLQNLEADDPAVRSSAVQSLSDELSPISRRAIAGIAQNDPDDAVRKAAIAAQSTQAARVRFYGVLEILFFGLSLGSVLVLAAIGLAITFGVMGVINMAHGELIMLGAYCAWAMQQLMPQSLALALLLSIPVAFMISGLVGVLIERGVIRFLYGRPLETLLATFGISLILQQLVRTFISTQNVPVANPAFMSGVLEINSVLSLTLNRIYILVFCLIVFMLLLQLLRRTRFGLEVRAVSQNRAMARAMGVRSARVDAMTFGLGAGIAGIAGVALSQLTNVGPNLGQAYIVDSFMVVVFGGVGNLWGTLIGGMTLGVANKFMEPWAGAILAKILVLVFLIAFIQKRPRGLFPQRGRAVEAG